MEKVQAVTIVTFPGDWFFSLPVTLASSQSWRSVCLSSLTLSLSLSDVLALPIFKQEDSSLPTESETKNPPFQYVMCTATSPAIKLHDETLTYLNQGETHNTVPACQGLGCTSPGLSFCLLLITTDLIWFVLSGSTHPLFNYYFLN